MVFRKTLRAAILGLGIVAGIGTLPALSVADNPPPAQPAGIDPIAKFKTTVDSLNLTADQQPKIEALFTAAHDEVKSLPKIDDPKENRKAILAVVDKLRKNVSELLTDDQNIALVKKTYTPQFDRVKAKLHKPEMKLTDDQAKKIDAILDDTMKKFVAISAEGRKTDTDVRPKILDASKKMQDQLMALLTPDQQALANAK